jgi:hypothetical protein
LSPFPQARRRAELSGALDWDGVLEPAFLVVAADASWSVKDGVGTVGIDVDLDPRPDEMGTHRALRDLQLQGPVGDAIVVANLPLLFDAQDLVEIDAWDRREGRALAGRLNRKARVVGWQIDVADESVGRLDLRDPREPEFLDQTILKRPERALRTAPRLGRSEERPSLDGLCGEKAPMGSTPNCASARPTWVGQPRSISPALVVRK